MGNAMYGPFNLPQDEPEGDARNLDRRQFMKVAGVGLSIVATMLHPRTAVAATSEPEPSVLYRAHVEDYGDLDWVRDGEVAGTQGEGKRFEDLQVKADSDIEGEIQYRLHIQDIGWSQWVSQGHSAGTQGRGLRAEAVQIRLTGKLSEKYDVIYRCHCAFAGTLAWCKNGATAGSTGLSLRMESVEIKIVKKGSPESKAATGKGAQLSKPKLTIQPHCADIGWMKAVGENETAGTTGQSRRLEALIVSMTDINGKGSGISARCHIAGIGWEEKWSSSGKRIGTEGQSRAIEAVQIQPTGMAANVFDIYVRVHCSGLGWLGYAKNGAPAGTTGGSIQAEAIQVVLVNKGDPFDTGGPAYYDYSSNSSASGIHLQHHMSKSMKQGDYGGNFAKYGCLAMSYAIGLSIINNQSYNPTSFYKSGVGAYYPNGGYWTGYYDPSEIVSDLKAGKPSIFYMNYGSGRKHGVCIIGLRAGADQQNPSYGDFIVIDPASGSECPLTSAWGWSSFRSVNDIRRF